MIQDRAAIVTGAACGIGLSVARKLTARGAGLVLHGLRNSGDVEPLRSSLADQYGLLVIDQCADLSNSGEAVPFACSPVQDAITDIALPLNGSWATRYGNDE
ncbi:SDR family NAD(P)-dependent oxidoreductase [Paraburkholderia sp. EG287A]|uniref:SDR family NAD(P)-dependent oxidoreductase n=1 Tax=unclassified Paraburkholderia TaxID=2615204 RepID=UPI0034D181E4